MRYKEEGGCEQIHTRHLRPLLWTHPKHFHPVLHPAAHSVVCMCDEHSDSLTPGFVTTSNRDFFSPYCTNGLTMQTVTFHVDKCDSACTN